MQDLPHTRVHRDRAPPSPSIPPPTATTNTLCASASPTMTNTLTMTSQVMLTGPGGKTYLARVLLDSGSSMTLICSEAAQALSLPTTHAKVPFTGALDEPLQSTNSLVHVSLSSLQANQQALPISAAVVSKVTRNLPLKDVSCVRSLPHIQNLPLADPAFHLPGRIDLLLGGDVVSQIKLPEIKCGALNMPVAFSTTLGWAIMGPYQSSTQHHSSALSAYEATIPTNPTENQLSSAQEIEEPGSHSPTSTVVEEAPEVHVKPTHLCLDYLCRSQLVPQKATDLPPGEENPAPGRLQSQENKHSTSTEIT